MRGAKARWNGPEVIADFELWIADFEEAQDPEVIADFELRMLKRRTSES